MDARRFSPATARNREPILNVLCGVLPQNARVLEIASGSGEHAVFMARALPGIVWQPSDPESDARASIAAWIAQENLSNVLPPLAIDVRERDWSVEGSFDAVVAINMIHYSPWESTRALFDGAGRVLGTMGVVFLYGPYKRGGRHTAPSNEAFEQWLKERDPAFAVRDLDDVEREAGGYGFFMKDVVEMPANNLSLIFRR
ncbi:MAG TPA: DUF938 domain-containing protein [Rhizomicrobium sp.]|nr:DUF938 domain-containing protein [Rhizomicrobium sp.]